MTTCFIIVLADVYHKWTYRMNDPWLTVEGTIYCVWGKGIRFKDYNTNQKPNRLSAGVLINDTQSFFCPIRFCLLKLIMFVKMDIWQYPFCWVWFYGISSPFGISALPCLYPAAFYFEGRKCSGSCFWPMPNRLSPQTPMLFGPVDRYDARQEPMVDVSQKSLTSKPVELWIKSR